ncbi:MAG TPA: ABC transporter permease [Propionibacteriaceae bacterium]|jgi:peptide/nickel transport system permease protein|nr:ABC transporter permease [Propionibacteriaceae bacterium]
MKLSSFTSRFWVAAALIAFTLLLGGIGPLIVNTDPNATIGGLYDPPNGSSVAMWLGTDNEGQSVMANLVYGIRTSLLVGLIAGAVATLVGVIIGLVSGYVGGWVDDILSAITNIALAIPTLIVIILVSVALQSRTPTILALVIGFTAWPWLARAVRAQSTSVRTREHIDVAKLSGARSITILAWDVLPYLLSYVVMAFVLQVSAAILFEATLSLLGLGPSGSVSLGIMLYWAIAWGSIRTGAWWAFLPPTIMLSIISFSLLLLQSSLDEVFNPRLRRGKVRRRAAAEERADSQLAAASPQTGEAPALETPVTAGGGR